MHIGAGPEANICTGQDEGSGKGRSVIGPEVILVIDFHCTCNTRDTILGII